MLALSLLLIAPVHAGRADKKAAKAMHAYDNVQMYKALKHCSKAMKIDPTHVDANAVCGGVLLVIGAESQDAELMTMGSELLAFVGTVEPDHPIVTSWDALLKMMTTPQLIPEPDPHCGPAAMGAWDKAEIAFGQGDVLGARDHYEAALNSCEHPRLWTYYGDTFFNLGDLDGAIAAYDRALEIEPCYWVARRFKGDALFQKGFQDEGIRWTASALACNPQYEPAWAYLQPVLDDRVQAARAPKPRFEPGVLEMNVEDQPAPWTSTVLVMYGVTLAQPGNRLAMETLATNVVLDHLVAEDTLHDPGMELWQLLAEAQTAGQQEEATYVLMLDEFLLEGFMSYREENLDGLTDYILSLMND